jgi:hypothetical protein
MAWGHSYSLSSLRRFKITLVVQGHSLGTWHWASNLKTFLWLVFTLAAWVYFSGSRLHQQHEVTPGAWSHSRCVKLLMRLRVTLTLRKGLSPRNYSYRSIHFYRTQFVMCFDWKYWLYISGYKHPYKSANVQMDRSTKIKKFLKMKEDV